MIGFLKAGQSIARVSDAGLPSISDPGHDLVKAAIEEEIAVVTVPGASAGISAFDCQWFSSTTTYLSRFLTEKIRPAKAIFRLKKITQKLRFSTNRPPCIRYIGKYARSLR